MKATLENLKKLEASNTLCEVEWNDVVSKIREEKKIVNKTNIRELFCKCYSFGKIYKYDKYGVVVMGEDADDEIDYTAIPIGLIVNIKEAKTE